MFGCCGRFFELVTNEKHDDDEVDGHSQYDDYCSSGGVDVGVDDI